MLDFSKLLTIDNLLKKVSPYQIFKFYVPDMKIGSVINSPLRKDSKPSFGFFARGNDLLYHDFATGESGNWIKFIMQLFGLSTLKDALRQVNYDMNLGLYAKVTNNKKVVIPHDKEIMNKGSTEIHPTIREWTDDDLRYWGQYHISKELLIKSNTYPLFSYYVNQGMTRLADKYAYLYYFGEIDGLKRFKIYQPFNKEWKWVANINVNVVDGINELEYKSDKLIITKSRKDRLVLSLLGHESIATNNETSFLPESVLKELKKAYKRVYVLFDNDETGMKFSKEVTNQYLLNNLTIPKGFGVKDISDFIKKYGKFNATQLINRLIEKNG